MSNKIWNLIPLLAAAGIAGCASEPQPTEPPNQVAKTVVATGAKAEILAIDDGSFVVTQSGAKGISPLVIPDTLLKQGDPIELFKYLAPGKQVPETLVEANNRSLAMLKAEANAGAPGAQAASASPVADERGSSPEFIYADDLPQSNWTGYPGCPVSYFSNNFCRSDDSTDDIKPVYCYYNKTWAFLEHPSAIGGWGAVCADRGQLTFRITAGTVHEYTVDQGSWRSGLILHKRTCNFWGCRDVRNFIRFEIVNRPDGSVGHFASQIDR